MATSDQLSGTTELANRPTFVMKHVSGGKIIFPFLWYFHKNTPNPGFEPKHYYMQFKKDKLLEAVFQFLPIENEWGYIIHRESGMILHPLGNMLNPADNTKLIIHPDRHYAGLFAIDYSNKCIVHKGSLRFIHPNEGSPNPVDDTYAVLNKDKHDAMKFILVDATLDSNDEIVNVYDHPIEDGYWQIINMVKNPQAGHQLTLSYKEGKSTTHSTKSAVEFVWEADLEVSKKMFTASTKIGLKEMAEKASTLTWTEEKSRSYTITVEAGQKTVVTWQFVFAGYGNGHTSIWESNLMADTNSEDEYPDNVAAYAV